MILRPTIAVAIAAIPILRRSALKRVRQFVDAPDHQVESSRRGAGSTIRPSPYSSGRDT